MERTVDRTSYRRSTRNTSSNVKKVEENNRSFKFLNIFLNQLIVSLLIIVLILVAQYFEIDSVTNWICENVLDGYEISEVLAVIKNKFGDKANVVATSGESFNLANELTMSVSGETSGDVSGETGFITAVEGINQMSEDAKLINSKYDFSLPLKGTVTSIFGCRVSESAVVSSYHTGLDIAANNGTKIFAAHGGMVTLAKTFSSYGKCVMIEDGDLVTLYAHCSSLDVKEGQEVKAGDLIARVGMTGNATGPHLHFEVRYEGRYVNPKDVLGEI